MLLVFTAVAFLISELLYPGNHTSLCTNKSDYKGGTITGGRSSMDLLLWGVRAVLIAVGLILAIMIWKGKKEGRYQRYSLRFLVIGISALILGFILLIVSSVTDLSFDSGLYLSVAGVIAIIIGLVVRNIWERNR